LLPAFVEERRVCGSNEETMPQIPMLPGSGPPGYLPQGYISQTPPSEPGNRAVVVTIEGETSDLQFVLTRGGCNWKIDLLASAQAGLGG
jgi:hypothetical protein